MELGSTPGGILGDPTTPSMGIEPEFFSTQSRCSPTQLVLAQIWKFTSEQSCLGLGCKTAFALAYALGERNVFMHVCVQTVHSILP